MAGQHLKTKINILTGYVIISTIVFGCLFFFLYQKTQNNKTDELTAKRINLIGEDGSLRMVLSNETRQHSGRINGKDLPKRKRPAGIIFFDNNGNECGGLVYAETKKDGKIHKGMSFTMDNYKNDQVVQIIDDETYKPDDNRIRRGLVINEFPVGADMSLFINKLDSINKIADTATRNAAIQQLLEKEGSRRRLFLGRSAENQSGLFLYDNAGKLRLEIYVDSSGNPGMKALDAKGNVKKVTAF